MDIPARVVEDAEGSDTGKIRPFAAYAVDGKSGSCEDMIETLAARVAELEAQLSQMKDGGNVEKLNVLGAVLSLLFLPKHRREM